MAYFGIFIKIIIQEKIRVFFEKNDFFFLIFALPGSTFIMYGLEIGINFIPFWIGLGITIYGAAYFFVHDLFIHQRIKVLKNTKNKYLLAIRRGHKAHHKKLSNITENASVCC